MPGSLSDYCEAALLNQLFGGTPYNTPTNLYFGYMVGAPGEAGPGAEPNFGGYQRVTVTNNTQNFAITSNQIKQNTTEIQFSEASSNHGLVVALGVWDSPTSGNMLAYFPLATPVNISVGDAMKVPVGSITLQFEAGGLSNHVKNGLLNMLLGGIPFSAPGTHFFALSTTTPTDAVAGTEPSTGGYARVAIANTSINFPPTSVGTKILGSDVNFPESTGNQGTVTHVQIFDAASGGNYLGRYALSGSQAITTGTIPVIPANSLTFTLD